MIWHEKCFKILGLKCWPKESKSYPTLRNIMNSSFQSQQKSQVSLLAKKPVFKSAEIWIGTCSCLSSDLHTRTPQGWPEGRMQGGKLAESGTQHILPSPRGVFQRYHRARSSKGGWVQDGKIGNAPCTATWPMASKASWSCCCAQGSTFPNPKHWAEKSFLLSKISLQVFSGREEIHMVFETGWSSPAGR